MKMHPEPRELVVLGGGLAGLSLALQVKDRRPQSKVLVLEKYIHPVPEAAFKVGESSSESGAHYFANVLGMKEHMDRCQLQKLGLRFYFTAGDNRDLTKRVEAGPTFFPYVPGYQLDRGRFENALVEACRARGVEVWEGVSVRDVTVTRERGRPHSVSIRQGERDLDIQARWLADASGRSSPLRRRLGLEQEAAHKANAAWFRIQDVIDVQTWSADEAWRAQVSGAPRSLSTTHLMGRGYWVWLIRLASGSTSVGIVADADIHPIDTMNTFERSLDWLRKFEPQCAVEIESRRDRLQDFLTIRHFAHGAKRVYSHHRWCLTGDAGPFTDPLYSPGSDFIAFGNTNITDLVTRELEGEDIVRRAEFYNRAYLNIFDTFLTLFERRYPIMGNAQVMLAKVVWDFTAYWSSIALLYFRGKLCDLSFIATNAHLWPMTALNRAMQEFFTVWREHETTSWQPRYVDLQKIPYLYGDLHRSLVKERTDDEVRQALEANFARMGDVALEMARRAIGPPEHRMADGRRTRSEALLAALPGAVRARYLNGESAPAIAADLERIWLERAAAALAV